MTKGVTIVIPTYNRSDQLDKTLKSITNDEFGLHSQIIVSDDGSSDDTERVVLKYKKIGLKIDYTYQDDRGFRAAKARNSALKLAHQSILIFLDTGMIIVPGFIKAHLSEHLTSSEPIAVIGRSCGFDRNNENSVELDEALNADGGIFEIISDARFSDPREIVFRHCSDNLQKLRAPWALMWTCNCSIELDVFRIVGGFNENFLSWGGEDTELGYRLARCGITFRLSRDAVAVHTPHPKNGAELQTQSMANFIRETAIYHDDLLIRFKELGDIGVNLEKDA